MKKIVLLILITLIISKLSLGIEISGKISSETSSQIINNKSKLNLNNRLELNDLKSYIKAAVTFKSEFYDNSSGKLILEIKDQSSSFSEEDLAQEIYIKEAYIDYMGKYFSSRIGKQYIKWGDGIFFNPADIINVSRDPLRPVNEAQGKSFIQISIPIQSYLGIDLVTAIDSEQEVEKDELPLITKLSFNYDNLGGFVFTKLAKNEKPVYGADLNYARTLGDNAELSFYSEGIMKNESSVQKFNSLGIKEKLNEDRYFATSIGAILNYSFPFNTKFDNIKFNTEYYHNNENWKKNDLKNFFNALSDESANLDYFRAFSNSQNYIFNNFNVTNVFISYLNFDLKNIININDGSTIFIPQLNCLINNNTELKCGTEIYLGKNDSEFGNLMAEQKYYAAIEMFF